MASPMPVLPLVGSTIVSPGLRRPSRSAASIMLRAMRSLTLPAGLNDSTLPSSSADPAWTTRFKRTSGVPPTRSSTVFAIFLSFFMALLDHVPFATTLGSAFALSEISDRGVVEHAHHSLADGLPHLPLGAPAIAGAGAGLVEAVAEHYRAFERLDDFAYTQVVGITHEGVPPLR